MIRIDGAQGGVGDLIPDLTFPTLDGAPFPIRSLKGRPFLLFFWGSW